MTYQSLDEVIADPVFARVDTDLRRGRHIGADYDPSMFDFLTAAKPYLDGFYERYDATLMMRQEGYFYLLPDRSAVPPLLGQRRLTAMDMLVGQALALMRLDPRWLESDLQIPDAAVLARLEQILGEDRLLRMSLRQRGKNDDQDARKLRDMFSASLYSLDQQGFIKRTGRGVSAVLKPLTAIMRFADPVRTSDDLEAALQSLIEDGQIADGQDDIEPDTRV